MIDSELVKNEMAHYIDFCIDATLALGKLPNAREILLKEASLLKKKPVPIDFVGNRINLSEIKQRHTDNVVKQIVQVARNTGMSDELTEVLAIVARLHDIGRFYQAVLNDEYAEERNAFTGSKVFDKNLVFNDFSHERGLFILRDQNGNPLKDSDGNIKYVRNHALAGKVLLDNGKIKELSGDSALEEAIKNAVLYHQMANAKLPVELRPKFEIRDVERSLKKLLSRINNFNKEQIIVSALLTQLIKDVDCLDILHQHLTGEYPIIRKKIPIVKEGFDKNGLKVTLSLDEIIDKWCMIKENDADKIKFIKEVIKKANNKSIEELEKSIKIDIPVNDPETGEAIIDLNKFVMPEDLRNDFLNLKPIDLQVINKRIDWNPIVGMWWRLREFLGNIRFSENLIYVRESGLLDQIFNLYVEKGIGKNVEEAFIIAKEVLLNLDRTKEGIYTTQPLVLKKH